MNDKFIVKESVVYQPKNCSSKYQKSNKFEVATNQQTHRTLIHQEAVADIQRVITKEIPMKVLRKKYESTYNSHRNMKARCLEFGIELSPQFEVFIDFLAEMGPVPNPGDTIDRIDPSGSYTIGNVRWADKLVQARNRRNVRHLNFMGETLPLVAWAERMNVPASRLRGRAQNGWTDEQIITGIRPQVKHKSFVGTTPSPFQWSRYTPWPEGDEIIWERAYQREMPSCSRAKFMLDHAKVSLGRIAEKAELLPPADEERSVEEAKLEAALIVKNNFFTRALKKANHLLDHGRMLRVEPALPVAIERQMQEILDIHCN